MGAQSLDYPHLVLGRYPRIYAAGAHGLSELVFAHFVYLRPREAFAGAREYAELFCRGAGRSRVIPGYHDRSYTRAAAGFYRLICLLARRVFHAYEPAEGKPCLVGFSVFRIARRNRYHSERAVGER